MCIDFNVYITASLFPGVEDGRGGAVLGKFPSTDLLFCFLLIPRFFFLLLFQGREESTMPSFWMYMDDQQNQIRAEASTAGCSLMTPDATDSPMLTGPEVDPVNAAAHLQLLGESLSHIGHRLQGTKCQVVSVLLDSLLCALAPLACLTSLVPELRSCPSHSHTLTLDNIAYVMPGL
uniref:Uncharacterized protein n=1 Tax=Salmo trutta TaxID=8032 RepID=A0A674DX51_SALTR